MQLSSKYQYHNTPKGLLRILGQICALASLILVERGGIGSLD